MPKGNFATGPGVSTAGFGKVGYCVLCSFKDAGTQRQFDQKTGSMWTPRQLNQWLTEHDLPNYNRQTFYSHRQHVLHPKDRMVSAVVKHERTVGTQPQKATDEQFLDSIISAGAQKVIDNPDDVTIDHAIRAVQVKAQAKAGGKDALAVLVQFLTTITPLQPSPMVLAVTEGEYIELPEEAQSL